MLTASVTSADRKVIMGEEPASDELREYLAAELRAAGRVATRAGADPDAVTADLEERLRRVNLMLAALDTPTEPSST